MGRGGGEGRGKGGGEGCGEGVRKGVGKKGVILLIVEVKSEETKWHLDQDLVFRSDSLCGIKFVEQ